MAGKRTYKKYDVIVDGKIVKSGITTDLERREREHKANGPTHELGKLVGQ
jgi:predicted GIY-YIG superfamily endonuclease